MCSRTWRAGLTLDDLKIFPMLALNEAVREAVESGAGATAGKLRAIPIDLPPPRFYPGATATGTCAWGSGRW
jgi:hypothetical protein